MKIQSKLHLFLLWSVLLMVILVSGVAIIANDFRNHFNNIYEYNSRTSESIKIIQNLQLDIAREIAIMKNPTNVGVTINNSPNQSLIINSRTNAQGNITKLEKLNKNNGFFKQFRKNDVIFKNWESDVFILLAENKQQKALNALFAQGSVLHSDYSNEILQLSNANRNFIETSIGSISGSFQKDYLWLFGIVIFVTGLGMGTSYWVVRTIIVRLQRISEFMRIFMSDPSKLPTRLPGQSRDEIGEVSDAFNSLASSLEVKSIEEQNSRQSLQGMLWMKTHLVELMSALTGLTDYSEVGNLLLSKLTSLMGASHGGFFVATLDENKTKRLMLVSTFAHTERKHISNSWLFGEGLVGQSALEKKPIVLTNVPSDYIRISSGLGETSPSQIVVSPVIYGGEVYAVIELAFLTPMDRQQKMLMDEVVDGLGILLSNMASQMKLANLLLESQQMTEELQSQSEELLSQQDKLTKMNVELEEHTEYQSRVAEQLRTQQNELEQSNQDLLEKNTLLARKNDEIEKIRVNLERQTETLERTSQYKSEFLANVSHELRTPLNSLLILAKLLTENKEGNLSEKQVEYAEAIFSSGNDLLSLINNILDLAKVESGKEEIYQSAMRIEDVKALIERRFTGVAIDRGLHFSVTVDSTVPQAINTDEQKVLQIITNLLSNAFKFTPSGEIRLRIMELEDDTIPEELKSGKGRRVIAFEVKDTGIGIPKQKQMLIFDAFRQADGSISRNYGGTGLGLAISRELARLLGGIIKVESEEGNGSLFTFFLPEMADIISVQEPAAPVLMDITQQDKTPSDILDSPRKLSFGDNILNGKRILIVDDDIRNVFAMSSILESENIEVKIAENGEECIRMLSESDDVDLILMDIMMPVMDGFSTIRHIRSMENFVDLPIIVVTGKAEDDNRQKAIECGSSDYISKPINLTQFLSLLRVWLYDSNRGKARQ